MSTKPPLPDSESLIRLMNRLPRASDISEAIAVLRDELLEILPDVDQVVVGVDMMRDLPDPDGYPAVAGSVRQFMVHDGSGRRVMITVADPRSPSSSTLLELCRENGYPDELYHPPVCFEIEYHDQRPLGTIVLWRSIAKAPIHRRTLAFMPHLLPFLGNVLANTMMRHDIVSPPKGFC